MAGERQRRDQGSNTQSQDRKFTQVRSSIDEVYLFLPKTPLKHAKPCSNSSVTHVTTSTHKKMQKIDFLKVQNVAPEHFNKSYYHATVSV